MPAGPLQDTLLDQSNFVFRGTVKELSAATMPNVPITKQTVIVHVDQVLKASKMLSGYEGKDITVQLAKGRNAKPGGQAIFYTNGWLFGESIAVQSTGETDLSNASRAMPGGSFQLTSDSELREHVADAALIVTGKVVSISRVESNEGGGPTSRSKGVRKTTRVSEHSANWNEAVVEIASVDKGHTEKRQITVRYPSSNDVAWAKAPKLDVGQEGVFLLHEAEGAEKSSLTGGSKVARGQGNFVVRHASDVLPAEKTSEVIQLIDSK